MDRNRVNRDIAELQRLAEEVKNGNMTPEQAMERADSLFESAANAPENRNNPLWTFASTLKDALAELASSYSSKEQSIRDSLPLLLDSFIVPTLAISDVDPKWVAKHIHDLRKAITLSIMGTFKNYILEHGGRVGEEDQIHEEFDETLADWASDSGTDDGRDPGSRG